MKTKQQQGFTIIEIIVVATIIALLATIGVTAYNSVSKQSRDAKRRADVENIRAALEQYRSDTNYYPASPLSTALVPTYLNSVPTDPIAGKTYLYCPSGGVAPNYTSYEVCSALESTSGSTCGCSNDCGSSTCNYKVNPLGVAP